MTEKKLGKIASATLGVGGYQGAMFGLSIRLSMDGGSSACGDFKGTWAKYPKHGAQYTAAELDEGHAQTYAFIRQLMDDAKVDEFTKLVGTPVELEFDCMVLKSWRVLTEVL